MLVIEISSNPLRSFSSASVLHKANLKKSLEREIGNWSCRSRRRLRRLLSRFLHMALFARRLRRRRGEVMRTFLTGDYTGSVRVTVHGLPIA